MDGLGLILVLLFVGGFAVMVKRTIEMASRDLQGDLAQATENGAAPIVVRTYANNPIGRQQMAGEIALMEKFGYDMTHQTGTGSGVVVTYRRR